MPSEEQLITVLQNKTLTQCRIYLDTHQLILKTLPNVAYSVDCGDGMTGYGAGQFGYDGWGMAALGAYTKWVSLMFLRGADLEDPAGVLEGTGKKMRHVKLRSPEEFSERRAALVRLVKAAAGLNEI